MKNLYIAEKPSVAREFAAALKIKGNKRDGYIESEEGIVTWCVGHLVTMSYPDAYDVALKKWSMETLPFLPKTFRYEVIGGVAKQFGIVKELLNRSDVGCIYVCTDSGREGEYIYRLVDEMAGVMGKEKRRVWIDSQTEEEILRGIREAKSLNEYDNLSDSAYLRAKEDYLMGINFSRILTLKYSYTVKSYLKKDKCVISVGRVMTCVLGMIVRREREIRAFVKTPFYRALGNIMLANTTFEAEWKAVEGTKYFQSPFLYKENGFKEESYAKELVSFLEEPKPMTALVEKVEKKKENKNPPLLYNLAELQNDCSRLFKISPDETLKIVQELYEKKLITYPRTDARVLSVAVSKEIYKNINGLKTYIHAKEYAEEIIEHARYQGLEKTRYVNDKQITDHYAIIPTGQGFNALHSVSVQAGNVYEVIARRFLSIFYPAAKYQKIGLTLNRNGERLFANFKLLIDEGYLKVTRLSFIKKKETEEEESKEKYSQEMITATMSLKKGAVLSVDRFEIKEGETTPPKRYTSGTLILAMENAGQLIEDEELREQIKGSGIGTSATRAEIIKKLIGNQYLSLNKKTQVVTPALMGEMIYDVVLYSIQSLLNPELTASWEKGLSYIADGTITKEEYMKKLEDFISVRTNAVKGLSNQNALKQAFDHAAQFYQKDSGKYKKQIKKQK